MEIILYILGGIIGLIVLAFVGAALWDYLIYPIINGLKEGSKGAVEGWKEGNGNDYGGADKD